MMPNRRPTIKSWLLLAAAFGGSLACTGRLGPLRGGWYFSSDAAARAVSGSGLLLCLALAPVLGLRTRRAIALAIFLVRFGLDAAWMALEFGLAPRLRSHPAAGPVISRIGWLLDHVVTIDLGVGHLFAWWHGPRVPLPPDNWAYGWWSAAVNVLCYSGPAALLVSAAYALFAVLLAETCSPAPGEPRREPVWSIAARVASSPVVRAPAARSLVLVALCCGCAWSALGAFPYQLLNSIAPSNRLTFVAGSSGLFIAGALVAMFVRKLPVVALCCFTLRIALNAVSLGASGSLPPLGNWWGAGGALLFVRRLVAIDTTTPLAISNWLGIGYVPVAAVAAIIFSAAYALFAVAFALTCNERRTEQSSGA